MIPVQEVVSKMEAALDAEGSDRYLFEQDYRPAINSAVDWLVVVFHSAFADKKLSEEDLRELITVGIWQANQFSRVSFDSNVVGHDLWSVLKINPEPEVYPDTTPPALLSPETSVYRNDLTYVKSKYAAKRLSTEKWEENVENVFEAGNEVLLNKFKSYSYLNFSNYSSTNYNVSLGELEIRPSVAGEFVAMTYLRHPGKVDLITDDIPFPLTVIDLLSKKALNFISYKQGDKTNLFSVTERDVATLVKLMV